MIWRILFPIYFMFLDIEEATENVVIRNAHDLFILHAIENKEEYNKKVLSKLETN